MPYRVPLPWEDDQRARRLPDADPRPDSTPGGDCGIPGAAVLAERVATQDEEDPDARRRGAAGAAAALLKESDRRGWGYTPETARARVDRARHKAAVKRSG